MPGMTALRYLRESGVATTQEIMVFARENPKDFKDLIRYAGEEMIAKGITVEEPTKQ